MVGTRAMAAAHAAAAASISLDFIHAVIVALWGWGVVQTLKL
jgi:hypothetical protein